MRRLTTPRRRRHASVVSVLVALALPLWLLLTAGHTGLPDAGLDLLAVAAALLLLAVLASLVHRTHCLARQITRDTDTGAPPRAHAGTDKEPPR